MAPVLPKRNKIGEKISETRDSSGKPSLTSKSAGAKPKCSIKPEGKDEKTRKLYQKVQDLEASIRELDLQLELIRAETTEARSKNCKELLEILASESSENADMIKNDRRFLELFGDEDYYGQPVKVSSTRSKNIRLPKFKGCETEKSTFVEDEEEQEIDLFAGDEDFRLPKLEECKPKKSVIVEDEEKPKVVPSTSKLDDPAILKNSKPSCSAVDDQTKSNPLHVDKSSIKLFKRLQFKSKINAKA